MGKVISVIIPTINEEQALPATLARLCAEPPPFEMIVADGGSTDRTVKIASAHPGVAVIGAPKGRASQMNAGARAASGEWLLFLHADTLLPPGGLARIALLPSAVHAGCFRQRFSGRDWRLRSISRIHNWRCSHTGVIYGDQAMFVRRALFWSLGGFPDTPILEDVMLGERLVDVTRPLLLDEHVITDSRKFVQMGIAASFARVLAILLCYQFRLPIPARAFFNDVR